MICSDKKKRVKDCHWFYIYIVSIYFKYAFDCFHTVCTCVFPQGQRRPLCLYDFLDLGEVEDNIRRAQACKKTRHFIVDPELAKLVTEHLGPDLQDAKTVIFDCNPGK